MKTIYKVCGGDWGGTNVDERFLHFISDLLGPEVIETLKNECRSEYLEFLRTFEFKKRAMDVDSSARVVLKVPVGFMDVLLENYGTTLQDKIKTSQHKGAVSLVGDKLIIEHSLFKSFFQNSVDDIISHIRGIFDAKCCRNLTGVVMVGGFADSTIVNFAIKKAFPEMKFIIPLDAGLAVVKGAVLYGHDPDVICSRICRYTYGEDICIPFDEFKHSEKKSTRIEEKKYCADIFRKFFTVGQVVSLGEAKEMSCRLSFVDEHRKHGRFEPISISVYVSDKESPMYIDDEGCLLLGKIEVKCNGDIWPEIVYIDTKMEIAGTEIKVTSKMHTGEEVTATFDFL